MFTSTELYLVTALRCLFARMVAYLAGDQLFNRISRFYRGLCIRYDTFWVLSRGWEDCLSSQLLTSESGAPVLFIDYSWEALRKMITVLPMTVDSNKI